jgi:hypothetical protein
VPDLIDPDELSKHGKAKASRRVVARKRATSVRRAKKKPRKTK